jgi:hypothetical protein
MKNKTVLLGFVILIFCSVLSLPISFSYAAEAPFTFIGIEEEMRYEEILASIKSKDLQYIEGVSQSVDLDKIPEHLKIRVPSSIQNSIDKLKELKREAGEIFGEKYSQNIEEWPVKLIMVNFDHSDIFNMLGIKTDAKSGKLCSMTVVMDHSEKVITKLKDKYGEPIDGILWVNNQSALLLDRKDDQMFIYYFFGKNIYEYLSTIQDRIVQIKDKREEEMEEAF